MVDDGGTDGTAGVCRDAAAAYELPVRYIYTHNPGNTQCSHARNVGINSTDCEIVITSEPEMCFQTDVVAQMTRGHEADRLRGDESFVNAGRILHENREGVLTETVDWQAMFVALYRREWLLAVRGWDEHFPSPWGWDDVDLGTRLRISGVGQRNDRDICAMHLWHPSRATGNQWPNESHFRSKGFHGDERPDHPDLVANKNDADWGVPKPRP